jgi:single-strand DNA-binding protein
MNSITIIGNICNDLVLKTTPNGKNVCSFNIAVKRPFAKDVTDFFTVVCWNKQAENLCQYCGKGTKIGISGMLTSRKWQDQNGNNRIAYEILANEVEFLEKKTDGQSNAVASDYNDNSFGDGFVIVNDSDDDLPF